MFGDLCKKRLQNFSADHPAKVLERADENVVLDSIMKLLEDFIRTLDDSTDREIMRLIYAGAITDRGRTASRTQVAKRSVETAENS